MKTILVTELFGSMYEPDLQFEAKTNKEALEKYRERRKIDGSTKIVPDTQKYLWVPSNMGLCVQEGHYEDDKKWIRGKRYFYKMYKPETINNL